MAARKKSTRGAMLEIPFRFVALAAFTFFLVPILVFFGGWLRWYWAILFSAILLYGFVWLYRSDYLRNRDVIRIGKGHLAGIAALFGLWVLMSGNCGFSVEEWDIPWRNVMLRDLITYDWPVRYEETGFAFVYYFVFWLVPALVGKVLGWQAALVALWVGQTAIITTSFLLISHVLKARKPSQFWMIACVFVLFSGLNLVGTAITQIAGKNLYGLGLSHCEPYCDYFLTQYPTNFYYRGNQDFLEEAYNQMVLWLAVPLMLQNRKIHSYMFLGLIMLPFTPWATVGIIPLMIALGCVELFSKNGDGGRKSVSYALKAVFSPANLAALVSCAGVFAVFLISANSLGGGASEAAAAASSGAPSGSFGIIPLWELPLSITAAYVLFCVMEFGVFACFLFRDHKRDPLFWTAVVWLVAVPLIWVGTVTQRNFCLNASLPALCLIMIWIMQYLKDRVMGKPLDLRNLAFVVVLFLAFSSCVLALGHKVDFMLRAESLYVPGTSTTMTTFEGQEIEDVSNFVAPSPDDSLFFKYLARN